MTTINIRIEEKLKKEASKTLASLGMDTSSAIKMFLTQVVAHKGLPFRPTRNPKDIRAEWDREVAETLKSGKSFTNAKDMMIDILGKKEYERLSK